VVFHQYSKSGRGQFSILSTSLRCTAPPPSPPLFASQVYANFIQSKPTLENFKKRIQFVHASIQIETGLLCTFCNKKYRSVKSFVAHFSFITEFFEISDYTLCGPFSSTILLYIVDSSRSSSLGPPHGRHPCALCYVWPASKSKTSKKLKSYADRPFRVTPQKSANWKAPPVYIPDTARTFNAQKASLTENISKPVYIHPLKRDYQRERTG